MFVTSGRFGFSAARTPADEFITGSGFPGCGPEPEQCDNLPVDGGEITLLDTRQRLMPQIMIAVNVFVPKTRVVRIGHRLQPGPRQLMQRRTQRRPGGGGFREVDLRLNRLVQDHAMPGSRMIPARNSFLALLALKLWDIG